MTDQSQALRRMPQPFYMDFDVSTIKHLGLQMYSTLPPVVGELIANAWDANATSVQITIPETPIDELTSEIVIVDTPWVRQKRQNLERSRIFVRRYADLLEMVKRVHREFIQRYGELKARQG